MLNDLISTRSEFMPRTKPKPPALPPFSLELYVDTKEGAHLLGVDRRTASALANTGRILGMKIGRDWWLLRTSLQEYLETKAPTGKKPGRAPRLKKDV